MNNTIKNQALKAESYLPAGQAGKLTANKGFTLVEVLISIAIIAVLVSVVNLRVRTPDNITIETLAQRVAADLERCRTLARTEGEIVKLDFNDGSNYYRIMLNGDEIDRYTYSSSIDDDVEDVYFNGNGSSTNSSGSTAVEREIRFESTSGSSSRNIKVYGESGAVIIE